MGRHTLALAALLLLVSALAQAAPGRRPLHLVTEATGNGIRLRVVGMSDAACVARYALDVSSRSPGGHNRSVQRGTARLSPGTPAVVATSALVGTAAQGWTAQLSVEGCGPGDRYEERAGAPRTATP
jgi:hypothetical protein